MLTGKVVLITGGGSGIGKEVALHFADAHAAVLVCDLNAASARATSDQIAERGGCATSCHLDVRQAESVEAAVALAVSAYGRLDASVNSAGIGRVSPRLAEGTESEYERVFDVNVRGIFLSMKYQIQQMLRQTSGGTIINISSIEGHIAYGFAHHYTASKHAVEGYTKAAAVDYARDGIRINAISPGIVKTPMTDNFDPLSTDAAAILSRYPAGRVATPADIAGAAVFLASDMASYITGVSIPVDGGFLAH